MKALALRLMALIAALVFSGAVHACEIYTSTELDPGKRVLSWSEDLDLVLQEGQEKTIFGTGSAGTGTGIRIAFNLSNPDDAREISERDDGSFWLGPEKFVPYCD